MWGCNVSICDKKSHRGQGGGRGSRCRFVGSAEKRLKNGGERGQWPRWGGGWMHLVSSELDSRGHWVVEAGKVNWHPEPVVVHPVRRPRVGRRPGGGGEEHGFPRGTCRQLVQPRVDGVPVGQFPDVLVLIPFRTTAFPR